MTILHHPGDELLLSYAAGATDEAMSLVLATHLALCPQCRRTVGQAEAAGGAMLEDNTPAPLRDGALQSALSRLDDRPVAKSVVPRGAFTAPEPLRSYLGGDLDRVKWTNLAGGIYFKPLCRRGESRVYLIRSKAGCGVGWHTHHGEELTLCLTGGYTDETGRYARGDLQSATPDILHRPVADEGEDCIVLAMSDARLKFSSPLVALIGHWFGF
ncbi:MAG TPA: ChrR family anti-sigma-E factor [Rhizomicrobium sp.]|jgi:putative transcriptional regulator